MKTIKLKCHIEHESDNYDFEKWWKENHENQFRLKSPEPLYKEMAEKAWVSSYDDVISHLKELLQTRYNSARLSFESGNLDYPTIQYYCACMVEAVEIARRFSIKLEEREWR